MSECEQPSPPRVQATAPAPSGVGTVRTQLHLQSAQVDTALARPTPRALSPLSSRQEHSASWEESQSAVDSTELADPLAEDTNDGLDTAIAELKKALLEDSNDEAAPQRNRGRCKQARKDKRLAKQSFGKKPTGNVDMGETLQFWTTYDADRVVTKAAPAWRAAKDSDSFVSEREALQRTHGDQRAKLLSHINAGRMKSAALEATGNNAARMGEESKRGVADSLRAMGAQRKELVDARRALEKIVVGTATDMKEMRSLFRKNMESPPPPSEPLSSARSSSERKVGVAKRPIALDSPVASPRTKRGFDEDQQRLQLKTLDARTLKVLSPGALPAMTVSARKGDVAYSPVLAKGQRRNRVDASGQLL